MKGQAEALAAYFAEETDTFDPEYVFSILDRFSNDFTKANKENNEYKEVHISYYYFYCCDDDDDDVYLCDFCSVSLRQRRRRI